MHRGPKIYTVKEVPVKHVTTPIKWLNLWSDFEPFCPITSVKSRRRLHHEIILSLFKFFVVKPEVSWLGWQKSCVHAVWPHNMDDLCKFVPAKSKYFGFMHCCAAVIGMNRVLSRFNCYMQGLIPPEQDLRPRRLGQAPIWPPFDTIKVSKYILCNRPIWCYLHNPFISQ